MERGSVDEQPVTGRLWGRSVANKADAAGVGVAVGRSALPMAVPGSHRSQSPPCGAGASGSPKVHRPASAGDGSLAIFRYKQATSQHTQTRISEPFPDSSSGRPATEAGPTVLWLSATSHLILRLPRRRANPAVRAMGRPSAGCPARTGQGASSPSQAHRACSKSGT